MALNAWGCTAFQDQIAASIGASGSPHATVVLVVMGSLLVVNAVFYVFLMHILYSILLRNMGYTTSKIPWLVRKHIFKGLVEEET